MNFSFGVCVSEKTTSHHLISQLRAIKQAASHLKYYETILCGHLSNEAYTEVQEIAEYFSLKYLPYEGSADKPGHITKKKNMIADIAFFDNLCLMHDYFRIPEDFCQHIPAKYNIYVVPIRTLEGKQHSDWVVNPNKLQAYIDSTPGAAEDLMKVAPHENAPKYVCGVPYSMTSLIPIQYISGGFITIKTNIMRDNPFDENLFWGDAEDLVWSEKVVPKYGLVTKAFETKVQPVRIMKPNKWAVSRMPDSVINGLKDFYGL